MLSLKEPEKMSISLVDYPDTTDSETENDDEVIPKSIKTISRKRKKQLNIE